MNALAKTLGSMLIGGVVGMATLPLIIVPGMPEVTAALIGVAVVNGGLIIGGAAGLVRMRRIQP